MNIRQRLIVTDWINAEINRVFRSTIGPKNQHHMIWTMLHAADADFSYPQENPANSPMHKFSRTSLFDLFGEEEARHMIDAARGIDAPPRIVSSERFDPELERLLQEEEEIEARIRKENGE